MESKVKRIAGLSIEGHCSQGDKRFQEKYVFNCQFGKLTLYKRVVIWVKTLNGDK
jgi:hypothetical protein